MHASEKTLIRALLVRAIREAGEALARVEECTDAADRILLAGSIEAVGVHATRALILVSDAPAAHGALQLLEAGSD